MPERFALTPAVLQRLERSTDAPRYARGLRAEDQATLWALHAQDGLYSVWEMQDSEVQVRVIGSIMEWIDASGDRAEAITAMADPATRIISLTITEGGYCLGADGLLDTKHPDVAHDLGRGPAHPRSAIGLIVAALRARRLDGNGGVTLLSCDNLVANGRQLQGAVLGFARIADPNLAQWIKQEVSFPCSMVDRITPAPDAQRQALLTGSASFTDAAPIVAKNGRNGCSKMISPPAGRTGNRRARYSRAQ